jgi:hypothetical protein
LEGDIGGASARRVSDAIIGLNDAVPFKLAQNRDLRRYPEFSESASPLMLLEQLYQRFNGGQVELPLIDSPFDRVQRLRYCLVRDDPFGEGFGLRRPGSRSINVPLDDRGRPERLLVFRRVARVTRG